MTGRSSDTVTASEAMIIKHIEYYFGDFNLSRNNFLKEKMQEDDGWVTIETILKFNRLKKITDDAQMICEALKKSSSGLMEVSEQGDKIRRSPSKPLQVNTKNRYNDIIARTVYAKPFPLDVKLDDLHAFFEGYGQLHEVIMRKHSIHETFKRSVFVTFANKENAAKLVNEYETKFNGQVLTIRFANTGFYFSKKSQAKIIKGKKDTEGKPHKKGEDGTKEEETETDLEERISQKMTKNAVLHLNYLNCKTSREQVKAFFSKYADVVCVDIVKGTTEGYIRLGEPDSAGSTLEKAKSTNDGKIVIHGSEIEVRVVEGDEELQYWMKIFKDIADKKKAGGRDRRQGAKRQGGGQPLTDGGRNRGGPYCRRKQNKKEASSDGEEKDTDEPPAKIIKSEMILKFNQVLNLQDILSDEEEQDTEEPPAKTIMSEMILKFEEVMTLTDA